MKSFCSLHLCMPLLLTPIVARPPLSVSPQYIALCLPPSWVSSCSASTEGAELAFQETRRHRDGGTLGCQRRAPHSPAGSGVPRAPAPGAPAGRGQARSRAQRGHAWAAPPRRLSRRLICRGRSCRNTRVPPNKLPRLL
jgi:hypothetical protein